MTASWDAFYRDGHVLTPSPFALSVAARLTATAPPAGILIDLGCGNGRDSLYFAERGLPVIGLDNSEAAIASARAAAASNRSRQQHPRFIRADLASEAAWQDLTAVLDATGLASEAAWQDLAAVLDATGLSGARIYYGRFLLHALEPDRRHAVISHLARAMREADLALFEFRTPLDAALPKRYAHERWYVDPIELARETEGLGLQMRVDASGTGLAPWDGEEPVVARTTITKAGFRPGPK